MQRVALRDQDLAAHQVDARDHLGDGVLDLNARVHLDEEELLPLDVDEKLHRAGGLIAHRPAEPHRGIADPRAEVARQIDARRDLDDLLMATLHGAVPLPEVDEIAVRVAEDLHLDVLGTPDEALDEHVSPSERRARFALGFLQLPGELVGVVYHAHAAAAAAEAGLDDDRKSDVFRRRPHLLEIRDGLLRPGHRRHLCITRQVLRGDLVAERVELFGSRADEREARGGAGAGKLGVLGEKAVAGMNRVHAVAQRHVDDRGDVQVRPYRLAALRRPDHERLVRLEPMQ